MDGWIDGRKEGINIKATTTKTVLKSNILFKWARRVQLPCF